MQIKVVICFAFTKKYDRIAVVVVVVVSIELKGSIPHSPPFLHQQLQWKVQFFTTLNSKWRKLWERAHTHVHHSPYYPFSDGIFDLSLNNYLVSFITLVYSIKCIWRIHHTVYNQQNPFYIDIVTINFFVCVCAIWLWFLAL